MADIDRQFWQDNWKQRHGEANPFAQRVVDTVRSSDGKTLLDVGCGDGRDSLLFHAVGFRVTAIDFSKSGIQRLKEAEPAINARMMDAQDMQFPDESFDIVYAHLSLHYFDNDATDKVFGRIHRMLKRGGLLFVKCKSMNDPLYGVGEKIGEDTYVSDHTRHFFSEEYLRAKLKHFTITDFQKSTDEYDGMQSAFVEAIARKE